MIMSTPLPAVQTTNLDQPNALSAYNICFALERNSDTVEDCIHARILGYLILNAPSLDAQAEVIKAVNSCSEDERRLLELGRCFELWFICPFKKFKGSTPAPLEHVSNLEFNNLKENLKAKTITPPRDHQAAGIQALYRDEYKCPVTGIYDILAVDASLVNPDVVTGAVRTELTYILPQSTPFTSTNSLEDYKALVLKVLKSFGYDVEKTNGSQVHSLYNVITMEWNVHEAFDELRLWFESTGKKNCYHVKAIYPYPLLHSEVTFMSPDPLTLPNPSAQFLALHAACAKVAHLSGASDYIDKLYDDIDDELDEC